ncbi:MAG TPA: nitrite reductase, partial [Chloroflexi bacterium]|nr:nitrite reductase [Chloroflexota bacterium]
MPSTLADLLSKKEIETAVQYLLSLPNAELAAASEQTTLGEAPTLTEAEWEKATQIFFDRCAGCHGVLRNGATGPALTPENTLPKGTVGLATIIFNGTPRGMPDWGKQGTLTQEETELMAKFIQNEPPQPPEMSLEQMTASWNVLIPVDQRPTEP